MARRLDLIGQQFGRLTVVELGNTVKGQSHWKCRCSCGNDAVVSASELRKAAGTKSCGCLRRELMRERARTHGLSRTPIYKIWCGMKERCTLPSSENYRNYGGRGISVCQRWSDSFEAFLADVGPRPSKLHSIERKDNEGNYEPGNVRWALSDEQNANKRTNVHLEHGGRRLTLAQWAKEAGVDRAVVRARLARGWTVEDAVTKPGLERNWNPRRGAR